MTSSRRRCANLDRVRQRDVRETSRLTRAVRRDVYFGGARATRRSSPTTALPEAGRQRVRRRACRVVERDDHWLARGVVRASARRRPARGGGERRAAASSAGERFVGARLGLKGRRARAAINAFEKQRRRGGAATTSSRALGDVLSAFMAANISEFRRRQPVVRVLAGQCARGLRAPPRPRAAARRVRRRRLDHVLARVVRDRHHHLECETHLAEPLLVGHARTWRCSSRRGRSARRRRSPTSARTRTAWCGDRQIARLERGGAAAADGELPCFRRQLEPLDDRQPGRAAPVRRAPRGGAPRRRRRRRPRRPRRRRQPPRRRAAKRRASQVHDARAGAARCACAELRARVVRSVCRASTSRNGSFAARALVLATRMLTFSMRARPCCSPRRTREGLTAALRARRPDHARARPRARGCVRTHAPSV